MGKKRYGGLKTNCIFRPAKAKLEMEKKMTLPILPTRLCCSVSKQHKAQLTIPRVELFGIFVVKMADDGAVYSKCLNKRDTHNKGETVPKVAFFQL